MKMYFEADATGNYLHNEDNSIVARCDVPEGASEDYGYTTMKNAIIKALEAADIEIDIEWWYGEADQLEADAEADCEVDVDIDIEEE